MFELCLTANKLFIDFFRLLHIIKLKEENPCLKLGQKKADNLSRKSGQKKAVNPYRK